MKTQYILFSILFALVRLSLGGAPFGTAFTYQGRLNDGGASANGLYDLRFVLYDAPTNGTALSGFNSQATPVTNGLFVVALDFGAAAFTGEARWLEIAVRTNGSGAFAILSSRQPLTPAPYAIYASSAVTASNASVANAVASNAIPARGIASGQVVKSLNGLKDAVTLTPGANVTLATNGNTLQISASGGEPAGGWSLSGNSGTIAGVNFIGTMDNQPLELKVNGQRAFRLEPTVDDDWHASIVNVLGGSPLNYIAPGTYGSVIAGGGSGRY